MFRDSPVANRTGLGSLAVVPIKARDLKRAGADFKPSYFAERIGETRLVGDTVENGICNGESVTGDGLLVAPRPKPNELSDHGVRVDAQGSMRIRISASQSPG